MAVLEIKKECAEFRANVKREISSYEYVILGGSWSGYWGYPAFIGDLEETVAFLINEGRKVVILGQIPRFEFYDRNCSLRNQRYSQVDCEQHAQRKVKHWDTPIEYLKTVAAQYPEVSYFGISESICDPERSPYRDANPIYFDAGHKSIYGSELLARRMRPNYRRY